MKASWTKTSVVLVLTTEKDRNNNNNKNQSNVCTIVLSLLSELLEIIIHPAPLTCYFVIQNVITVCFMVPVNMLDPIQKQFCYVWVMLTVMASYGYHGQHAAGIGPDCIQIQTQIHYSPSFTTRQVSRKQ